MRLWGDLFQPLKSNAEAYSKYLNILNSWFNSVYTSLPYLCVVLNFGPGSSFAILQKFCRILRNWNTLLSPLRRLPEAGFSGRAETIIFPSHSRSPPSSITHGRSLLRNAYATNESRADLLYRRECPSSIRPTRPLSHLSNSTQYDIWYITAGQYSVSSHSHSRTQISTTSRFPLCDTSDPCLSACC